MYIPEFWAGVGATVGVELIALIAASISIGRRNRRDKDKLKSDEEKAAEISAAIKKTSHV